MSSQSSKKVLFFTAAALISAAEQSQVDRLATIYSNVQVRNGAAAAADVVFGSTNLESYDFLAGTLPASYSGAAGAGAVTIAVPASLAPNNLPDQFKVFPATLALTAAGTEHSVLAAVKGEIGLTGTTAGLAKLTNLTADASVGFVSSVPGVATVGAATGKVVAVAAGSTTITATLTVGTSTTTSTCVVTVT